MGKTRKNHDAQSSECSKGDSDTRAVKPTESIAKRATQMLAKSDKVHTIDSIEKALLKEYPASDAESWDRTGLLVGERALPVKKVAVALDPTVDAIERAHSFGADLLVTHHPLFLNPPTEFSPEKSVALSSGAGVWAAIRNNVAVMSFHTALDVSKAAQAMLPGMLGLSYKGQVVCPIPDSKSKGYGQFCKVAKTSKQAETLRSMSAKCISVFGRIPRVWGEPEAPVINVVTATGSAGNVAEKALEMGADCLICGELKYHSALDLSKAGLGIIELGHDVSELPLTAVIASSLTSIGIAKEDILVINQNDNWFYPETIRL